MTWAVAQFALAGVALLVVVGVVGVLVLRRVSTDEAIRQAEGTGAVAARAVQDRLTEGIVLGDVDSLLAIDARVTAGVLQAPVEAVSLRLDDGRVVYSSDPSEIGRTEPLDASERTALDGAGSTDSVVVPPPSDTGGVSTLEVARRVVTPKGTELLFRATLRFDSVAASSRRLWTAFIPVLAAALVVLAALQVPLGARLARRVRHGQQERERLLLHAVEASDVERRRIAGELHDGLGQQLVGLSMTLSAEADAIEHEDAAAAARLRLVADRTREQMRALRSALMGMHPPSLERAGLATALLDLGATLRSQDIEVDVQVPADVALPSTVEALLYRSAREAVRNVATHAQADRASIVVATELDRATLSVSDDGVGFDPNRLDEASADGHLGLAMIDDLARRAGGSLRSESRPGSGTTIRLEVPLP